MRHPDIDVLYQIERRREDIEQAAHERVIREAELAGRLSTGQPRSISLRKAARVLLLALARSLSFLGGHMVGWGCWLQSRYAVMAGMETQPAPCN